MAVCNMIKKGVESFNRCHRNELDELLEKNRWGVQYDTRIESSDQCKNAMVFDVVVSDKRGKIIFQKVVGSKGEAFNDEVLYNHLIAIIREEKLNKLGI